jgi:glycine/serine hydroxymethyltransferase
MAQIAAWIDEVVSSPEDEDVAKKVSGEIKELCASFPAPGVSSS